MVRVLVLVSCYFVVGLAVRTNHETTRR